ncbi:Flagellar biosynthesis protein FlhF [Tepidimonas alkaliphilus]|uniref:Flagellar biosynthesis protein FlhF n=1 Tax=Tepidimonas alkaliphilus TaxID=2588942 RepID=A0A554WB23_9BURK|nr:flagellar biosynthesis protein FlhF [Tepidimonas alkaliphilus]TSE20782.1 Flagellar biosynthesis protein FlhF [Tepidimonas alkaliphilus]
MNAQRFVAPNSREAMALARAAFGEQAVILSTRSTADGFEVVATSEEALARLAAQVAPQPVQPARTAGSGAASTGRASLQQRAAAQLPPLSPDSSVVQDAETLAMSTLSFQEYVRERMLRKRQAALEGKLPPPVEPARAARREPSAAAPQPPVAPRGADVTLNFGAAAPQAPAAKAAPPRPTGAAAAPSPAAAQLNAQLEGLRQMVEERFQTLAWLGQARLSPIQSTLMHKFIRAGFSPTVARAVLERLPAQLDAAGAWRWVLDVLAHNLRVAREPGLPCDEGGVFALVGPTGVGKTTTVAKLAAQCVRAYGAGSVGLITLDTYRVAGYEQLRAYGRMLGVVAHQAHDQAALQDLLELLAGKRLVLIDTPGLSQRDPRLKEMLALLQAPAVKKLLVLDAGRHGDTLDEVVQTYKGLGLHGAVLSKVDEAVKLAPAVDALLRHQLTLRGLSTGQRVPEDWQRAEAAALVRLSMGGGAKSPFEPQREELPYFFADAVAGGWQPQGVGHA